jgi:hypothetical protein
LNVIGNGRPRCIAEVEAEEIGGADSMSANGKSSQLIVVNGGVVRLAGRGRNRSNQNFGDSPRQIQTGATGSRLFFEKSAPAEHR